ncbi:MAG: hypothetical protein MI810_15915, partial [Flavobacteriales bacterium]|nr:hypothetical protein [Flavobacteriales bacterium]
HKATLSIWLGGSFCIYRLGLTALGVSHCPCLGSFSGAIGLDDSVTSSLLLGFALFLVGLGVWVLFNLHPSQPSKEALT